MKALILGIGGQDGSYLADILLVNGWEVHGLHRRSSVDNLWRINHIRDRVILHKGDLLDLASVTHVICTVQPDVIYNEADQDDANWSFENAGLAADVTYGFVAKILAWMHLMGCNAQFFQPLSATMFGNAQPPQDETTEFNPLSPYACAKTACYDLCQYYRNVHGMYVANAILYNHDSPRRGSAPLLQYLARSAVHIARGQQKNLPIATPDALVDIGHAEEFMWGVYRLMQLADPDDYVIATGKSLPIRYLAETALLEAGVKEPDLIVPNPDYVRADADVTLCGDSSKIYAATGWSANIPTEWLMRVIVQHHMETMP
jgi:GDPmannose 4,6-dehydratase